MAFILDEEGIRYVKLFKSVMLPFVEMRSIVVTKEATTITMKSGEVYSQKELTPVCVDDEFCNYVMRYNIEYRNDTECIEGTRPYSREELDPILERVIESTRSYADRIIKDKLGVEYSSELIFKEDMRWGNLFFCLKHNDVIIDMPDECSVDKDDEVPESYDNILLFFMCEWNPVAQRGYYAITADVEDEEILKDYVEDWTDTMCNDYEDYLDNLESE